MKIKEMIKELQSFPDDAGSMLQEQMDSAIDVYLSEVEM